MTVRLDRTFDTATPASRWGSGTGAHGRERLAVYEFSSRPTSLFYGNGAGKLGPLRHRVVLRRRNLAPLPAIGSLAFTVLMVPVSLTTSSTRLATPHRVRSADHSADRATSIAARFRVKVRVTNPGSITG